MIDELKILQEIVGDLSGIGLWVVVIYATYKLVLVCACVYVLKLGITCTYKHFSAGITKDQAEMYIKDIASYKRQHEDMQASHAREIERYKHMYKLLKEGKNSEQVDG